MHDETSSSGLGSRIREARLSRGLSQPALADALGVSSQAVGQWEKGATRPTHARLDLLASTLDRSLLWLLTGEDGGATPTDDAVRKVVEAYDQTAGAVDDAGVVDAGMIALAAVTTFDHLAALGRLGELDGNAFWRQVVTNYDALRATLLEFGSGEPPADAS